MLLSSRWNRVLTTLNIVALVLFFGYLAKEWVVPAVAEQLYRDDYKRLVFQCDNVMREHFIAKAEVMTSPSDDSIRNLHASEVGLLECHEYDTLRKKLISYGLSENQLAQIGLEAIEERAKDVRAFVQSHEIRY